jgi:hypothetical protein
MYDVAMYALLGALVASSLWVMLSGRRALAPMVSVGIFSAVLGALVTWHDQQRDAVEAGVDAALFTLLIVVSAASVVRRNRVIRRENDEAVAEHLGSMRRPGRN